MTDEAKALVERLLGKADTVAATNHSEWFLYTQAADRIEALEAEVERLREALKRIQHFSPAHMWRAPDIQAIASAALAGDSHDQ